VSIIDAIYRKTIPNKENLMKIEQEKEAVKGWSVGFNPSIYLNSLAIDRAPTDDLPPIIF
jgi:hypothetical protein